MNKQFFTKDLAQKKSKQCFQKNMAILLCIVMIVGVFTPLSSVPIMAAERYIHAAFDIDRNAYEFRVKADGATHGYIMGEFNNWLDSETYKLVRDENDHSRTGEMVLTVSADTIEKKGTGYKAKVYYDNSSQSWMSANGQDGNNENLNHIRAVKTEYHPSQNGQEDRVTFTVKANGALHGYIRSHGAGWSTDNIEEKFKFTRDAADDHKVQTMSLTVDYKDLIQAGKESEYKIILKYEGNDNYIWINHEGKENTGNSLLPERTGAPQGNTEPDNPGVNPVRSVRTVFHPATDDRESQVEFVIRADGLSEVYVMTQSNNWDKKNLAALHDFKATRASTDISGTEELTVTIPYSKLVHWYKKYQYKIYAKKENQDIWFNAEGKDAENSFFPTETGEEYDNILEAVVMDEQNTVKAALKDGYGNLTEEYEIFVDGVSKGIFSPQKNNMELQFDISSIWNQDFDIRNVMKIVRKDGKTKKNIVKRHILDQYQYLGDDMGVTHTPQGINLKLWAPTAKKVEVLLYDTYTNVGFEEEKKQPDHSFDMMYDGTSGIYSITLDKQYTDKFYLYRLTFGEEQKYAVDPYAVAVGVNGKMGALVDINSPETMPDGFAADQKPTLAKIEDSILYEMHVRDFTINSQWGGPQAKAGKYLGIIEKGTFYQDSVSGKKVKTGLDHLVELGVTHVHLLPTYDFATIDESAPAPYDSTSANEKANQRNWGYDPKNYNAPDGSYSMEPENPKTRIKEYRQMVMGLHQAGIRVVNDVVYNHMYDMENMNNIVEGYYFRSFPNGVYSNESGVGNALASERPMVRKFILDSCNHWVDNYKIDGLRFDLMAILDADTMKLVKEGMDSKNQNIIVYGEPWMALGSPLPEEKQTKKDKNIGFFNDTYRDALRGNNNPSKGYITGIYSNVNRVQDGLNAVDASDPEYIINYVEAHDNYAIWDQVEKSESGTADGRFRENIPQNALDDWRVDKALLGNAFVLLSQGIPFFQGGSEILRTKQGDHNSYRSNDVINDYDWRDKVEFEEVFDYYRGLIQIRKSQSLFRLNTKEAIRNHQEVGKLNFKNDMIYQYLKNNPKEEEWENIVVLYNVSNEQREITWLPGDHDEWKVVADDKGVYLDLEESSRRTVRRENGNYNFKIAQNSLMILYNDKEKPKADIHWHYLFADQSTDYMEPLEPSVSEEVTVRLRAKAGELTGAEVHYYVEGESEAKILSMTEVADLFYEQRGYDKNEVTFYEAKIPASDKKKYYHFKAMNHKLPGQEKEAWISAGKGEDGRGVRNSKGANGFSIVPGYQTSNWSKESIFYQIMVDRFRDGDNSNNKKKYDFAENGDKPELSPWGSEIFKGTESDGIWNNQFFGGDLIGVKEAIPYLKNTLGVDALYFMPIFQSDSDHKYDNSTYELVDDTFGGNKGLADLGQALKSSNMHYILDGAFNHSSSSGQLFKEHRDFFFKGVYYDDNGKQYDHFPWHQKYFNFAKLDYSKDATKDYIYRGEKAIAKRYLTAPYFAGGWRLDAAEDVSEIARDYKVNEQTDTAQMASNLKIWQEFKSEIHKVNPNSFILGEYWGNENHWYYGNAWDGKMNYGGFYLPYIENRSDNQWLGNQSLDNKGNMSVAGIIRFAKDYNANFPYSTILNSTNSLSTHDKPRFSNVDYVGKNNAGMMKLAQALQMTMPGIPMIYYGDEIGSHGKGNGADPYNRQSFDWNDDNWNYEMLNHYRKLIDVRKKHKDAFVYGALEELTANYDEKYVVFARYAKNDRAIIVLNNNGANNSRRITLEDVSRLGLKDGDSLVDVLSGNKAVVQDGALDIISKDMSAACFVPENGTVLLDDLNGADYDVNQILTSESDTRGSLAAPTEVTYEKQANGNLLLSYQLPLEEEVKGALIRVLSTDESREIKKIEQAKDKLSLILERVPAEYKIVVKTVAKKEVEETESILREKKDSDYVTATEKVVVPQPQPQPQPQSPGSSNSSENTEKIEPQTSNMPKVVIEQKEDKKYARVLLVDKKNEKTSVLLSEKDTAQLLSQGISSLEVKSETMESVIPKALLTELTSQTTEIALEKFSKEKEAIKEGVEPVSDWLMLSLKKKDSRQELMTDKALQIAIPYAIKQAEKQGNKKLAAFFIDENGVVKEIAHSVYDEKHQKMRFIAKPNVKVSLGYKEVEESFQDISGHYAKEAIDFVTSKGIMNGISKEKFSADGSMNRAMLITILGRLSQVNAQNYSNIVFKDVSENSYYAPYVAWGYENGLIKGVSDKEYAPESKLTREQVATILARYIQARNLELSIQAKEEFLDSHSFSDYAKESIAILQETGILQGADGSFRPQALIKRGEMSLILKRLIEYSLQR
ncbi:MAG: type I pullulanase [Eubacteriales bacterium]|nr:type I pullulanase [Eubacteriales bacterium]